MSSLFLKNGKFAVVSVLFFFIKNCKLPLARPSWACQRLPSEKATKLFMTHKSVREACGPSVYWSHRFFHCLAIFFFCCCMSFSHTHHIACIGLPALIQTWKAVPQNCRRVQGHLLLLQGSSYKTFQSKRHRKWFPKSHNAADIPQCRTITVWYADLVMSNGSKSHNSSFAEIGDGNNFKILHLFVVFYYFNGGLQRGTKDSDIIKRQYLTARKPNNRTLMLE